MELNKKTSIQTVDGHYFASENRRAVSVTMAHRVELGASVAGNPLSPKFNIGDLAVALAELCPRKGQRAGAKEAPQY